MRLIRACIIASAAACGAILGLGFIGMLMTPPEHRPGQWKREFGPASRRTPDEFWDGR